MIESAEEEERLLAHCRGLLLLLLVLLPDCCGLVTVHCFQLFFIGQICIEFTSHTCKVIDIVRNWFALVGRWVDLRAFLSRRAVWLDLTGCQVAVQPVNAI